MGFEYVYAYIENLTPFFVVGFILSLAILCFLVVLRMINEIDIDDWKILMIFNIPIVLFFGFFLCAPGIEHIRDIKEEATKLQLRALQSPNDVLCGPSNFLFKEPILIDKQFNNE